MASRAGFLRYALLRLLGFAATLLAASLLLILTLSGSGGFDGAGLAQAAERLTVTVPLALIAMLLASLIGIPSGYAAAVAPARAVDRTLMAAARLLTALPSFWLAMALVLLLAGLFRLAPPGGFVPWQQNFGGALSSLILPAFALALPLAALLTRRVRRELTGLAVSPQHFALRTTGLTSMQATLQMSRGLLPPLAAMLGQQFGLVLAGAMVVENVFYLPGLGRLLFDSVAAHNLPVTAAALIVLIGLTAIGRLAGDLVRAALDPRRIASAA